jgi:two-component system chemotaxis response regulator CheB
MKPITVLIVDDSALIRRMFTDILRDTPDIEVVDTAVNAEDAREKIKRHNPKVVTLDIEMPGMNGLAFLEKIMTLRPTPVIMASTLTQKGADAALQALELGAVDYISKPTGGPLGGSIEELKEELPSKIRAAATANLMRRRVLPPKTLRYKPRSDAKHTLIAIGSSTGGVEALREIFSMLPGNCPPIVMTQHMPQQFTPSFAARLDSLSEVTVAEATHNTILKYGHAYLAPGNRHMKIAKRGSELVCLIEDSPHVSGHRPSVDVLFDSVAQTVGAHAIGVILTGMGKDGAQGLLHMHAQGAQTIGQNQATCVVYGMPKAAYALGAVDIELPLQGIAGQIITFCEREKTHVDANA